MEAQAQRDAGAVGSTLRGARERLERIGAAGSGFALTPDDKGNLRAVLRALGDLERVCASYQAAGPAQRLQVAKASLVSLAIATREIRQARSFYQLKEEAQDEVVAEFVRLCAELERASGALAGQMTEEMGRAVVVPPRYNFGGLVVFAAVVLAALFVAFAKPRG